MTRPVVLYLPGLDGSGKLLFQQRALHARYRVVAEPYPQLLPHTYEQLADRAAEQLRVALAEECREQAVVLAESFGGAVALTLALRHTALVERLVLLNTFAWYPRRWLIEWAAWLSQWAPARPGPPSARIYREPFFFAPEIPRDVRTEWWQRTGDVPLCGYGYRVRLIAGLDLRPRLHEVTLPTLVIVAPNDRIVPAQCGRLLARRLPDARLLHLPTGHAGFVHPRLDVAELLDRC